MREKSLLNGRRMFEIISGVFKSERQGIFCVFCYEKGLSRRWTKPSQRKKGMFIYKGPLCLLSSFFI